MLLLYWAFSKTKLCERFQSGMGERELLHFHRLVWLYVLMTLVSNLNLDDTCTLEKVYSKFYTVEVINSPTLIGPVWRNMA